MAKKKITKKYNGYIPRGNYYSFGSDLNQAFDFKDSQNAMSSPLSGAVGALGSAVGQIGGSVISGGLESGAGKVFSGLSGVASAIPGPWGAVASAGLGVLGGLTNRMFGSKLNEENIAQVEGDIARMNSAKSNASSFDELNTTMANTVGKMNFSNSFIGKDGWFSNKAKKKAKALREANNIAAARQDLALINNAEQLSADQLGLLEANYAAKGGSIRRNNKFDTGGFEYEFTTSPSFGPTFDFTPAEMEEMDARQRYFNNREKLSELQSRPATTAIGKGAKAVFGEKAGLVGDLVSTGLSYIPIVGSGIGLLDLGSDIYDMVTNNDSNYSSDMANIGSDLLALLPGDKTFGAVRKMAKSSKATKIGTLLNRNTNKEIKKAAKKVVEAAKDAENDAIASVLARRTNKGFKPAMRAREKAKAIQSVAQDMYDTMNSKAYKYNQLKDASKMTNAANDVLGITNNWSFAEGGPIHIKKANRGKFTDYCGGKVTSECIARGKNSSSPAIRKRAVFAQNARGWKHDSGGNLFQVGGKKRRVNFSTHKPLSGRTFDVSNMEQLQDSLINRGFNEPQRLAILANVLEESGGNPKETSRNGKYKGIMQWGPDRYPNTEKIDEQIHAMIEQSLSSESPNWTHGGGGAPRINTAKGGFDSFWSSNNPYDAAMFLSKGFIRPGETGARVNRAKEAVNMQKHLKSMGGTITHGGVFDNGITTIDSGGSHEENPFEGVQIGVDPQGIPNLVEEGEVIFNDYVFSNRLIVPKAIRQKYKLGGQKDLTFADAVKRKSKVSEEMPNDPIEKRGLEAFMDVLANSQEELKAEDRMKEMNRQYAEGGRLGNLYDKGSWLTRGMFDNANFQASALASNIPYTRGKNTNLGSGISQKDFDEFTNYALTLSDSDDYWRNLSAKTGKDVKYLKDNYRRLRSDNKYGFVSMTPNKNASNKSKAMPEIKMAGLTGLYGSTELPNKIESFNKEGTVSQGLPIKKENSKDDKERPTWMRYAPIIGAGIGALSDIFSPIDYSEAERINSVDITPSLASFTPIGNYLTYKPFDRDYHINQLNANAAATRRGIGNISGGNRGAAMAGMLAADYNYGNSLGTMARQAEEFNRALEERVEGFNRQTNMFNSEGFNKTSMFNAGVMNDADKLRLAKAQSVAQMRQGLKNQRDASLSANLTNLFQGLGDIGWENEQRNWLDRLAKSGVLKMNTKGEYTGNISAKGGKIKTKKKKGFTYA